MPSAILKSADEIITMLQIKRSRRGLNAVQQRVYERLVKAEIAREAREMFGAE